MTNKKPIALSMLLVAIGLLLIVLPMLANSFTKVPDFLRGLLMGMGLVLEITGVVILRKKANI